MYISKVELRGFKSFSERTVLRLSPGLNVITGPNGTGKSNLIDAFRFVMGENSTRALRADRLSSLISDNLKDRSKRSYVRVVIDNRDRLIPVDQDEIVVTRYVNQRGESKYYLNRKRAPRLVVTNTLSMAGLNPRGYNIVVQGEISRVADKSPEEVRGMIEEAIGISSFDERKKQAELELREADVNLKVAVSKLEEVRNRIEELEREMNTAIAFTSLRDIVGELKRHSLSHELRIQESALRTVVGELEELAALADRIEEERRAIIGERKGLVEGLLKLDQRSEEVSRAASNELASALSERNLELNRAIWELQKSQETKRGLVPEISSSRQSRRRASDTLAVLRRRRRQTLAKVKALELRTEKLVVDRDRLRRSLERGKASLDGLSKEAKEADEALSRLRIELSQAEFQMRRTDEDLAELRREEYTTVGARRRHVKRYSKWTTRSARLSRKLEQMTREAQEFGEKLAESLSKAERLERGEIVVRELMVKLEAAAERVRGNFESAFWPIAASPDAVELILREAGVSVSGVLRNLVRCPSQLEPALEATLGDWLDSVVIGKGEDLAAIFVSLFNVGIGSARLIKQGEPREIERGDGRRLIDNLEFPPELYEFMQARIGDLVLASDAVEAAILSKRGVSVVTRDGLVLVAGVSAGSFSAQLDKSRHLLETLRSLESDLAEAGKLREEVLRRNIVDLRQGISGASSWLERVRDIRSEANKVLGELREKTKTEENLLQALEEKLSATRDRALSLNKGRRGIIVRLESLRKQVSRSKRRKRRLGAELALTSSQVASLQSSLLQTEARIRASDHALEVSRRKVAELLRQEKEVVARREEIVARIKEAAIGLRETHVALRTMSARRARLEADVSELKSKLERVTSGQPSFGEQRNRLADEIRRVDVSLEDVERRARETQSKTERAQLRKYEIEKAAAALRDKVDLLGGPRLFSPEWLDPSEVDALVKSLEPEVTVAGSVNMLAENQYSNQAQNYVLVSQRMNTLEEEKRAILELIAEIELNKREAFMGALQTVNKSFGEYFKDVTGGSAWLECEDLDDPFRGGLSVMVQFLGKGPRLVYGSSGGEKSVTALCLILALQQLKPAPFYFFDEIDAHLDARNVQNYIKLISIRASGSQLLVISLKDVVASGADRVIGTYVKGGKSRVMEMPISAVQRVRR